LPETEPEPLSITSSTASAVVADIIDIVKHAGIYSRNVWEKKDYNNLIDNDENKVNFFVRVGTKDAAQTKKSVLSSFGDVEFIALAKPVLEGEIAFLTGKAIEGELKKKIDLLGKTAEIRSTIRVEED
jgi:homoserine dehydrogenase